MKAFPINILQHKSGQLNAQIFKNDYLEIPPTLFYNIQIDLQKFEIDNQNIETNFRLDHIHFNIHQLKELEHKTFEFPINPEKGYIDGSVYLFERHNPVDVKKIEFLEIKNNIIPAIIHFNIVFEYENTGYANCTDCTMQLDIAFGNLSIDTDIMSANNYNKKDANDLATQFVSLQDYENPTIENNQIIYKIKTF